MSGALDSGKPFVCRIKTERQHYVYDVNRNVVLPVSPAVYDVVEHYGILTVSQLAARYRGVHSLGAIREAVNTVKKARANALLCGARPRQLRYGLDESSLRTIYSEKLGMMVLGVTEACNLRCDYCVFSGSYKDHRPHRARLMPREVAEKALRFLKEHSRLSQEVHIAFYGGEPLLNFGLIRHCVSFARDLFGRKHFAFHLTTNGTLLDRAACEFLVEHRVRILVSVDGPACIHDRYRRTQTGGPSFASVMRNLAALRAMAPSYYSEYVGFNVVLAPPRRDDIVSDFFRCDELVNSNNLTTAGVSDLQTTFFDRFTSTELDDSSVRALRRGYLDAMSEANGDGSSVARIDKVARSVFGRGLELLALKLGMTSSFQEVFHPGGICAPGLRKLFVCTTGDLYVCERASTADDLLCIGNVDEGLNVSKVFALITAYSRLHGQCHQCIALRHCALCYLNACRAGRFDRPTKARACRHWRGVFEQALTTLVTLLEKNPRALDYVRLMRLAD